MNKLKSNRKNSHRAIPICGLSFVLALSVGQTLISAPAHAWTLWGKTADHKTAEHALVLGSIQHQFDELADRVQYGRPSTALQYLQETANLQLFAQTPQLLTQRSLASLNDLHAKLRANQDSVQEILARNERDWSLSRASVKSVEQNHRMLNRKLNQAQKLQAEVDYLVQYKKPQTRLGHFLVALGLQKPAPRLPLVRAAEAASPRSVVLPPVPIVVARTGPSELMSSPSIAFNRSGSLPAIEHAPEMPVFIPVDREAQSSVPAALLRMPVARDSGSNWGIRPLGWGRVSGQVAPDSPIARSSGALVAVSAQRMSQGQNAWLRPRASTVVEAPIFLDENGGIIHFSAMRDGPRGWLPSEVEASESERANQGLSAI